MAKNQELSFENAITELQSVVEKLEAGQVTLEESLSLYERGMELVKLCNARLDAAEQRVQCVRLTANGADTEPFEAEDAK